MLWKCVEFTQDAISGLALLELAGVNSGQPPQIYDWGGGAYSVCQIDRQPTPVPNRCFGPTSGPNWSDWSVVSGKWIARTTGVTGYSVRDGDLEGWTYTSGYGAAPPAATFSQVCPGQPAPATTAAATRSIVPSAGRPDKTSAPATSSPMPTSSPSLEALAPTASPSQRVALAGTGPATRPPSPRAIAPWLFLVGATVLLVALGIVTVLRHGP